MRYFLLTLVSLSFFSLTATADPSANIKKQLEQSFPGIEIQTVTLSPVEGIYEVVANAGIVYVTADGKHAFNGNLLDLTRNAYNLTEEKRGVARLNAVEDLGESTMVVYAAKEPKYTVTVFTDVDCGYCRKFHQQVPELNELGVSVRYIAFPRAGIGSASYNTMVSIWCSDDKQEAMTTAKRGMGVDSKKCEHPIDAHLELVNALGLRGTPTMVHEDGTVTPGFLPTNQLIERIKLSANTK